MSKAVRGLFLVLAGALILAPATGAAADEGDGGITLQGTVVSTAQAAISPADREHSSPAIGEAECADLGLLISVIDGVSGNLDLAINTGPNGIKVATIRETCNSKSGYTVVISSVNSGVFASNDPGSGGTLRYTIRYAGKEHDLHTGAKVVTDAYSKTPESGADKDLEVVYNGARSMLSPGRTYSDILFVTVMAK